MAVAAEAGEMTTNRTATGAATATATPTMTTMVSHHPPVPTPHTTTVTETLSQGKMERHITTSMVARQDPLRKALLTEISMRSRGEAVSGRGPDRGMARYGYVRSAANL